MKQLLTVDVPAEGGREANRERLAALFDQHHDAVYRFSLARSGSPALAEDICAETFTEAARLYASASVEPVSIGWLLTVARRRLVDHWRSESRRRRRMERFTAEAQSQMSYDLIPEPDDQVVGALNSLSARQRAALTLRYLDDFSVVEVADALDCSYQAAESLLARARRSFIGAWEMMR